MPAAGRGRGCTGALLTSFAGQPGPYRLRVLRWMATANRAGLYTGLSVAASRSTSPRPRPADCG